MEIELIPVTVQEKERLSNMYQFYHYDFSRYTNEDLKEVTSDSVWSYLKGEVILMNSGVFQ
ncbi:hypothetical protein ABER23_04825 [Paenibacillus lautus]|uniref:hypothetical protein n=1 Tax=Paenibacillus lautus TaxID=1401 RepID=UPI003D26976F